MLLCSHTVLWPQICMMRFFWEVGAALLSMNIEHVFVETMSVRQCLVVFVHAHAFLYSCL